MFFFRPQVFAAIIAIVFSGAALALSSQMSSQEQQIPSRENFSLFPMQVGSWTGKRKSLDSDIVKALSVNDYLMANYQKAGNTDWRNVVNFYIAYYKTQSLGSAAHSPRACIPGGGWEIESFTQDVVKNPGRADLTVNRAIISKGRIKQLVYYWFVQRGQEVTGEYRVKWLLLVDGITKNRSDGALIRVVTPIRGKNIQEAEKRLGEFIKKFYPRTKPFLT